MSQLCDDRADAKPFANAMQAGLAGAEWVAQNPEHKASFSVRDIDGGCFVRITMLAGDGATVWLSNEGYTWE